MKKALICMLLALLILLPCAAYAAESGESYGDVPKVKSIKIDGEKEAVWDKALKLPIEKYLVDGPEEDAKGVGYMLWDEKNLYVLIEVTDPTVRQPDPAKQEATPWQTDSAEVFLNEANDGILTLQYRIDRSGYPSFIRNNAGTVGAEDMLFGKAKVTGLFEYAAKEVDGGYVVEYKIPFDSARKAGDKLGFMLQINDAQINDAQDAVLLLESAQGATSWDMTIYDYITLSDTKADAGKDNPKTGVVGFVPFALVLAASAGGMLWGKKSK